MTFHKINIDKNADYKKSSDYFRHKNKNDIALFTW